MRHILPGTIAARGMTLGRARLVQPSRYAVDTRPLADDEIESELTRLHLALDTARQELRELRGKLHGALAREVNEFIDAHSLLLDDPELLRGLDDLVKVGHYRPGAALKKQRDKLAAVFEAMDDPYLRSRKEDIDQVIARVISALQRQTSVEERKLAARVGEILIADTIAPADMAHLAGNGLLGVVASSGSPYSHSAILARSLGLPMLVGTRDALANIHDDDLILLDARAGGERARLAGGASHLLRFARRCQSGGDVVALARLRAAVRLGTLNVAMSATPVLESEGRPGGGGWIPWRPARPSVVFFRDPQSPS